MLFLQALANFIRITEHRRSDESWNHKEMEHLQHIRNLVGGPEYNRDASAAIVWLSDHYGLKTRGATP